MRLPFRGTPQSTNVDVAAVHEGANPVPELVFRELHPPQIISEDLQERDFEVYYDDVDAKEARAASATVASNLGKLVADLGLDLNKP